jgi:hypothetical protein
MPFKGPRHQAPLPRRGSLLLNIGHSNRIMGFHSVTLPLPLPPPNGQHASLESGQPDAANQVVISRHWLGRWRFGWFRRAGVGRSTNSPALQGKSTNSCQNTTQAYNLRIWISGASIIMPNRYLNGHIHLLYARYISNIC